MFTIKVAEAGCHLSLTCQPFKEMARNFVKEIENLTESKIHVKNAEEVNKKIQGIINDGFEDLQVVSDFDATITKQHENGKLHMSSFFMFQQCPSITQEYKKQTEVLTSKYRPLEHDPDIPLDQKRTLMEEWWKQSNIILRGLKVSTVEIEDVVGTLGTSLRDGTDLLFKDLSKRNVPVLVFSAGLGDTVVAVLKHYDVLLPNVKVISNFLNYDQEGIIQGFQGPLIHVFNKNEYAIKNSKHYDLIKERNNVILMGDSIGDASMADGMDHANHILRIGFIYENVEGNLPAYLDTFDIVLEDDQTMDVVSAIINLIK